MVKTNSKLKQIDAYYFQDSTITRTSDYNPEIPAHWNYVKNNRLYVTLACETWVKPFDDEEISGFYNCYIIHPLGHKFMWAKFEQVMVNDIVYRVIPRQRISKMRIYYTQPSSKLLKGLGI